jgi:hypothetical protein
VQYAINQVHSPRNVIKITTPALNLQDVSLDLGFTGYIDGTNTLLSPGTGAGSSATIAVDGGDVTVSSVTIPAGQNVASARVNSGRLILFATHAPGGIGVVVYGGTLEIDNSVSPGFTCHAGTLSATASQFSAAANSFGTCTTNLNRDLFSSDTAFQGSVSIQNSIFAVTTTNSNGPILLGTGSFRFNTIVGLYGMNNNQPIGCVDTIDASNNIVAFSSVGTVQCAMNYTLFDSVSGIQPGTGNRTGDVTTFFVDLANQDFHLSGSSPAIGGAQTGTNITGDYDANPRPSPSNTNPDMGAFEHP